MSRRWILVAVGGVAIASACSSSPGPARAPAFEPKGQAKCSIAMSKARPLVVEWPSADRAALESQARRGLVAVRYVGCEMEVLPRCKGPGSYTYTGLTRKRDRIVIQNEDELYGNIPMFAAKFEGKLRSAGQLNVAMTIVGQYEAERAQLEAKDLVGDCAEATHVITAITTGAFEFFAGADDAAGAEVAAAGAGIGARRASHRETLTQDGDDKACAAATVSDQRPPNGCGALLRVAVAPVVRPDAPAGGAAGANAKRAAPSKPAAEVRCDRSGMVSVRGGAMGLGAAERRVASFCIDTKEVAVRDYARCVANGECSAEGLRCGAESTYYDYDAAVGGPAAAKGDLPINCVDAAEAQRYCAKFGHRLPTELEWEWVARGGPRATPYPWGMAPRSVAEMTRGGRLVDVATSGTGSPEGIHALLGNVSEWTSTDAGGARVVRGGSYQDSDARFFATATSRTTRPPTDRSVAIGFRCVSNGLQSF